MAGYSYKWDCLICKQPQDTVNDPRLCICNLCIAHLAEALCTQKLMHSISDPGIDREYWMAEANKFATQLFLRWKPQ